MIKLIIFDLDNTLAPLGKPVSTRIVKKLKNFESRSIRIAIISGKPMDYLAGLSRQLGLQKLILSAENGAFISFNNEFPPRCEKVASLKKKEKVILNALQSKLHHAFGNQIRFQHNFFNLTVFPEKNYHLNEIYQTVNQCLLENTKSIFSVYLHYDAVEVVPKTINKGLALKRIKVKEKIKKNEIIAIGDSETDITMKKEAILIGIRLKNADYEVQSLNEAIHKIEKILTVKNRIN